MNPNVAILLNILIVCDSPEDNNYMKAHLIQLHLIVGWSF